VSGPRVRWLAEAPPGWDALVAADPGASPSHRPELWRAILAAVPGTSLRVAAVEQGGALVGGAPLLLERRAGFEWLHALPWLLPAPPLALPGRHGAIDAAIADAVAALASERRVVGGEWSAYRPAGPPIDGEVFARVPGETRWFEAAVVELGSGLDAARARMDRKQRQALQHARLRPLALTESPEMLEGAYALHLEQHRRWPGHRALPLELSRRLLAGEGAAPAARLFTLADRRGPLSAALALDGPHETFVWWSGTHPEGRRLGAFALLMWRIVEFAAAAGRARVNLGASTGLGGVAHFKHAFGATGVRYPVRWLSARHAGPAGRALAAVQALVRRGRARGEAA
jgi:hypothetical protein